MAIDPKNFPMPSEEEGDEMIEEGEDMEMEIEEEEAPSPLADFEDEEIMEEAKKRGLI